MLKRVDDAYIDRHFGVDRAQYERETAFALLQGGNIGLTSLVARNVKSNLVPGKELIMFKAPCMSKERAIVHTLYMVFENEVNGDYIPSPASYCTCENGALFCSHMLCFHYVMRVFQTRWKSKTQDEIEKLMPDDRTLLHTIPCVLELILARTHLKRQQAQSKRQSKRQRSD